MYARSNIFKYVKKKHGQDTLIVTRTLEDLKTRRMKTEANIHFIKTCKRENIIPTFAKVKLSIKHANKKLHSKIARLVMERELQAKHQTKKKIKREIKRLTFELKNTVNTIIFTAVIYKLNITTKSRSKALKKRHDQKLRRKNDYSSINDVSMFIKNTVHNFSSSSLTREEHVALPFGLEQHIPINTNKNLIYTEFEHFYQKEHGAYSIPNYLF